MKDLRTMSHVPRWGVLRVINRQSLADHSYYVTVYAMILADAMMLDTDETEMLLRYCLTHDMPEVFTTDIPGPVKRSVCDKASLSGYEHFGMMERFGFPVQPATPRVLAIAKVADLLDEINYLYSELRIGNSEVTMAINMSSKRLDDLLQQSVDYVGWTQQAKGKIQELRTCELSFVNLPKEI